MAEYYYTVYVYHIFFICSSVEGHLGCFHVLAIVNSSAMNIGVHVSFQVMVLSGYKPKSGSVGSDGSSIFSFFLGNLYTVFSWRRQWHSTSVLLPGKSHGRRNLVGCRLWGRTELDTTEWLHFHFSLTCVGEGNGNPLQCSCLENPRDGGAGWAAVYGVAQSRIRLKRLSSSSSSSILFSVVAAPIYIPTNSVGGLTRRLFKRKDDYLDLT